MYMQALVWAVVGVHTLLVHVTVDLIPEKNNKTITK
jgi:hypothetical protein